MGEMNEGVSRRHNWKQDPEGVRRQIIEAATAAFAEKGFDATRLEDIAAQTATSKRMIYYYFTDKNGLYDQVLAAAYQRVGIGEAALEIDTLPPVQALERLIGFMWDHNRSNPDFIRLVMNENLHRASALQRSGQIMGMRPHAVNGLAGIYQRGVRAGVFRDGIDPLKLRFFLSAVGFFNVSNRPSFTAVFGDRLFEDQEQAALRQMLIDTILGYVMTAEAKSGAVRSDTKFPHIDPQLHAFLDVWNDKWAALPAGSGPAERRKRFEVIAAEMRLPTPDDVDCSAEHWVESKAGPVRVRVFRHTGGGEQPCLIYMHGGAWMQGSPETHWDITSRFASWNRMTVVSVDYALAPESPYPAAADQCEAVAHWIKDNAASLGIDPTRIVVGGDSAGGNLAAAMALDLRGSDITLRGQLLIYPACDFDQSRPSYAENYDGPLLQVAGMDKVNAMYCPDAADLTNPRVAPLLAASHADLPPAYVAVAQFDPLRDSGTAYAEALAKAGVPVTNDDGKGLIHGYLRAMDYCEASMASMRRMSDWLAKVTA